MSVYGAGIFVALLIYLVLAAIAFGLLYLCIRLAVLAALKAHTQWLQSGQASGPPRPGPPPAGPPAGGPPYSGS